MSLSYPRTLAWNTARRRRYCLSRWRLRPRDLARRTRDSREMWRSCRTVGVVTSPSRCASRRRWRRPRPVPVRRPAADTAARRELLGAVLSSPRREARSGGATSVPEWSRAGWGGSFDPAAPLSATDCESGRSRSLQWRGSRCIQVLAVRRDVRPGHRTTYAASPLVHNNHTVRCHLNCYARAQLTVYCSFTIARNRIKPTIFIVLWSGLSYVLDIMIQRRSPMIRIFPSVLFASFWPYLLTICNLEIMRAIFTFTTTLTVAKMLWQVCSSLLDRMLVHRTCCSNHVVYGNSELVIHCESRNTQYSHCCNED